MDIIELTVGQLGAILTFASLTGTGVAAVILNIRPAWESTNDSIGKLVGGSILAAGSFTIVVLMLILILYLPG